MKPTKGFAQTIRELFVSGPPLVGAKPCANLVTWTLLSTTNKLINKFVKGNRIFFFINAVNIRNTVSKPSTITFAFNGE